MLVFWFFFVMIALLLVIFFGSVAMNKPLTHEEYLRHLEEMDTLPQGNAPPARHKPFGTTIYKGTGASGEVAYFIDD